MIHKGLSIDPYCPYYQNCRYYTDAGLQIASVVGGGYGIIRGLSTLGKVSRLSQIAAYANRNVVLRYYQVGLTHLKEVF